MMPGNSSLRFMRKATVLLLVLLFGAGVATGYGLARFGNPAAMPPAPESPPLIPGPRMYARLGLSAQQRQAVEAILQKYKPELDTILQETAPRVQAVHERILEEVRPLLDAEQLRRLEYLQTRSLWMRGSRRFGRGTMGGPGPCPGMGMGGPMGMHIEND